VRPFHLTLDLRAAFQQVEILTGQLVMDALLMATFRPS
jgi:hypothetical protein